MRKIAILAVLFATAAHAQTGVITTHPAGNPDGKILTMQETILSRDVHPAGMTGEDYKSLAEFGFSFSRTAPKAWSKDKSVFIKSQNGDTITVARSEAPGIVYGESVSRNEFGISGGLFWSPDSTKIAFYRKDESLVTDFPLLDITTRTGSLVNIKYPMNGMTSERITLGIYDLATGETVYAKVDDFDEERYLTNITWGPDSRRIFIQVLDRTQKHCRLNMYDAADGSYITTLLTEDSDKYTEPLDPLYFIDGTYHFIYRTASRDGFRNLYLCDTLGTVRRMTAVDADVEYVASTAEAVFYTSAEVSPVENHLFRMDFRTGRGRKAVSAANTVFRKPVRLTPEEGWHSVRFNGDMTHFLDTYSSFNVPRVINVRTADGGLVREVRRSEDPLKDYATGEVLFGTVKSADGKYDNHYRLFLPRGFDPEKKYPVILYVYGGPHSQMVRNTWLGQVRLWEMYMAQRGYIVYVQDNRGTSNRGLEYEQAIHRYCGQAEMADQMEGIKMLQSLPYVDSGRIGVHGWSYGGFMTISLMTNYPEVFKVGVAGGPVIDWKWYEVMYGERYMDTEAMNPDGFAKTSLINKAKDLKGKLLICQGAIDPTVVWEHSLSFIRECIKNNVQVDYFPYPCAEHNVMGKDRVHLMDKVSIYFDDYL